MINLQHRSLQKELLDGDEIPFAHIKKNMQELDVINRLLGGHAISLKGLAALINPSTKNITVCEIGCGGGDNLRAVANWCKQKGIDARLTGIDIKAECIGYARERNSHLKAAWVCSDYRLAKFDKGSPHIIFSSLFCHHFSEAELVDMMVWMNAHCSTGFFINDLQRHTLAYYSIKWITKLFSGSYLVKNDAPLSVARGFTKEELIHILDKAGIAHYSIKWQWAFRYLITVKKQPVK